MWPCPDANSKSEKVMQQPLWGWTGILMALMLGMGQEHHRGAQGRDN